MRKQSLWGVAALSLFVVWGEAQAQFMSGIPSPIEPIDEFDDLPQRPAPDDPGMEFLYAEAFTAPIEALALLISFKPPQINDLVYETLLSPTPAVFIGTDDTGPQRNGVSWQLFDIGPITEKGIRFDFEPQSTFEAGETLYFTFWFRGRFGEGHRIGFDSEFIAVPAPAIPVLGAIALLPAVRRRRRR